MQCEMRLEGVTEISPAWLFGPKKDNYVVLTTVGNVGRCSGRSVRLFNLKFTIEFTCI